LRASCSGTCIRSLAVGWGLLVAYVVEKRVGKIADYQRILLAEGFGFGHFLDVGGSDCRLFDQRFAI